MFQNQTFKSPGRRNPGSSVQQLAKIPNILNAPLTEATSMKMVRNFITAAFGCLAFLRGLFPDDHFIDDAFQSPNELNQLKPSIVRIKRLKQGVSDSADMLLSWIVSGRVGNIKSILSLTVMAERRDF